MREATAEDLLCAAALVLGSSVPLDPEHAEAIAELTGCGYVLADYDDAGRAVRVGSGEPGKALRRMR